jgi:predicted helicase
VGQASENDKNTNRKYPGKQGIDARVSETYAAASSATTTSRLNDPYIKAIRWATDRLGNNGVVAYVTNNGFLMRNDSDGVRKYLVAEFDAIYVIDLGGNIRKNPDLSGTTHNVFGIKPGVSIQLLIRKGASPRAAKIEYLPTGREWRKEERLKFLDNVQSLAQANWQELHPDDRNSWFSEEDGEGFGGFIPLGSAAVKEGSVDGAIMGVYSLGSNTNRDSWAYNFRRANLVNNIRRFVAAYNVEVRRWTALSEPEREALSIDDFLTDDESIVKWGSTLKQRLRAGELATFDTGKVVRSLYRPFCSQFQYFARLITHRSGWWLSFIPKGIPAENPAFCASGVGAERPFASFATKSIPDLNFFGPGSVPQWYPFYLYDEDGSNRRENITDWALAEFRKHYGDESISKWDIFHYTYGLLHHPEYRTRYAANLKRELPRIPMAPGFHEYARIGAALMTLHIDYESQDEYPLERREMGRLNWRVEKMVLSKDKTQLKYNDFLTLSGIPAEVYEYRLGNRSALEWVVDQYRVSTDARSGIVNDPNREDDPEYIVRLVGQVVTVSLRTVRLVGELAGLGMDQAGD